MLSGATPSEESLIVAEGWAPLPVAKFLSPAGEKKTSPEALTVAVTDFLAELRLSGWPLPSYPRACPRCGVMTAEAASALTAARRGGRRSYCKACDRRRGRAYYDARKDELYAQREAVREAAQQAELEALAETHRERAEAAKKEAAAGARR